MCDGFGRRTGHFPMRKVRWLSIVSDRPLRQPAAELFSRPSCWASASDCSVGAVPRSSLPSSPSLPRRPQIPPRSRQPRPKIRPHSPRSPRPTASHSRRSPLSSRLRHRHRHSPQSNSSPQLKWSAHRNRQLPLFRPNKHQLRRLQMEPCQLSSTRPWQRLRQPRHHNQPPPPPFNP